MSLNEIATVVLVALLVIGALATGIVMAGRHRTLNGVVEVHEISPDGRLAIRTPFGSGSARIVVHIDMGRVYEIALDLRGEGGPTLTYVPPAAAMVRANIAHRVDALHMKRNPSLNPPQEPTP